MRPLDDREEQFRRTLCSDELSWIDRFSEPLRRNHEFMRLRTGKEAALKALGMGLARHLDSFGVVPPPSPVGPGEVNGLRGRWTLHFPPLPQGFAGAVAALSRWGRGGRGRRYRRGTTRPLADR